VVVFERQADVGTRFHGDFQGLENWTTEGDVLEELAACGVEPGFAAAPVREQVCFGPGGRQVVLRSPEPFYYLVRRGVEPGTLDHALKQQALACGVELRFGEAAQLTDGGIVAHGPRESRIIAVGYVFETDHPDGAYVALWDRLAPGGYAYLLVQGGRGTLATCMFRNFRDERACLEHTVAFFQERVGARMERPQRFGGRGTYGAPLSGTRGDVLLAGEAGGFQDALWGFGLRYAMLSGHLAAKAWLDGDPQSYERLWQARLGGRVRTALVNRRIYGWFGDTGYRWLIRSLTRARSARGWMRAYCAPSWWKGVAYPVVCGARPQPAVSSSPPSKS
jgi:flavin-dependent dehydrogenase